MLAFLPEAARLGLQASATVDDMLCFAEAIRRFAGALSERDRIAVAWALRNRVAAGADYRARTGRRHPHFGGGSLSDAVAAFDAPQRFSAPQFGDPGYCRSWAAAMRVWCGEDKDPTDGAVVFHHHLESPAWVQGYSVTALIGEHFFYREAVYGHA